jgi:hypothetical protein
MKNEILSSIEPEILKKLPLTLFFIQSQIDARNEENVSPPKSSVKTIKIDFYEIKNYTPFGYVKPISKIINFSNYE